MEKPCPSACKESSISERNNQPTRVRRQRDWTCEERLLFTGHPKPNAVEPVEPDRLPFFQDECLAPPLAPAEWADQEMSSAIRDPRTRGSEVPAARNAKGRPWDHPASSNSPMCRLGLGVHGSWSLLKDLRYGCMVPFRSHPDSLWPVS